MIRVRTIVLALLVIGCGAREARSPRAEASFLATWRQASREMLAKEYSGAAQTYEAALAESPGDDTLMYYAARAHARAGAEDAAVRFIARMAAAGRGLVPEAHDFGTFGDTEAFRAAQAKAKEAAAPRRKSAVAFRIAEPGLVPEGIAHDAKTGAFFVGSIRKRKIIKIAEGRPPEDFATGLDAVLGLRVDPARNLLWAATEADEAMEGFTDADRGRTTLLAFDLATGKRAGTYPTAGARLLNDIAITKNGDVYVTDSEGGTIWRLRAGALGLTRAIDATPFVYPNGIASDGDAVFVADNYGVHRFDPRSGSFARLTHPPGVSMSGIDGLYVQGERLVGVQGPGTGRVVSFALDATHEGVTDMRVLDADNPENETPTTGAIVGASIYFIADSQVGRPNPSRDVVVLVAPL